MTKTNLGLVAYAQEVLRRDTIYILGGISRRLTEAHIQTRIKAGCQHTIANQAIIRRGIGKFAYDCNALFKCFLWETSPGVINYNQPRGSDLGSRELYNLATQKGPMSSMPNIPGLMVFTKDLGHVGMYIGMKDGVRQYIEATPSFGAWAVVTSADKDHPQGRNRAWTYWGKYHLVEYIEPTKPVSHLKAYTILKGDTLSGIAAKHMMNVFDLYKMNVDIIGDDIDKIRTGQTLRLDPNVVFVKQEVFVEVEKLKEINETIQKDGYSIQVIVKK